jgi:hypothetical protein
MKALTTCFILTLSFSAIAGDKKPIKLNNASWKSDLAIQDEVKDDDPVRLPSQSGKKKKKDFKPEKWEYSGPAQVDLDSADSTD